MESIRETSANSNKDYSYVDSISPIKKESLTVATNKIKRNYSYSSSIVQTPLLSNNNSYSFANISDNKHNVSKNTNFNEFMMSRERTVRRDVSYRSSFRRKHTTATDYLQNRELNITQSLAPPQNNRLSFYGHDVTRKPTLDPYKTKHSYNKSPNLKSIAPSSNGSVTDGKYTHSGSSNTNSFAVRNQQKMGSDENFDLNKKLSLSSLVTGTSSIAQVSIFRTSEVSDNDKSRHLSNKPSSYSELSIKKTRNNEPLETKNHRIISQKRVTSVNKNRTPSRSNKKSKNIMQSLEMYLNRLGKFSRKQIIKFKLIIKKMIKHKMNPADETYQKFSRTTSSLISNSKKRISSSRVVSRRLTSSLNSSIDLNGTFYNNIMKTDNLSRNNSIRRNLSLKLQNLIDERQKSLNMKLYQSEKKLPPPPVPSKGLSVKRSPSSMKRAVSVITTNTLKNEQEETTPTLKKDTFGTVKINRLGLETLDEREITEEDMTIRNSTIVNRSLRSDLRSESNGTSVYEKDVNSTSMLSFQYKNMKSDQRGINHKPSNIRVISGAFDDYEVTSMDYSFKSANDDILLDIVEESQENCDDKEELEGLLKQFIQEIIVKRVNNNLQLFYLERLKDLQMPRNRYEHKKNESWNATGFSKGKINVVRSLSMPVRSDYI
ncbi:uncharacterized protein HGUI_03360 [Hanseniaspora guilliermondii]|uniref:Uncharacterized protein n=1 Tax=Hanseniaspora guilliermondii TaxID=56406 RepID=A0A1L0B3T8_9ASCO|nr:uncharacterized protein HGUI_03360 [Hanseniaspora guilliermondii]